MSLEISCPCTGAELANVGGSSHGPCGSTTAGSGSLDTGLPLRSPSVIWFCLSILQPKEFPLVVSVAVFLRVVPFQLEDLTKELLKNSSEGRGQVSQPVEAFYGICFSSKSLSLLLCTYSGRESFHLTCFSVFQSSIELMRSTLVIKPYWFQIQTALEHMICVSHHGLPTNVVSFRHHLFTFIHFYHPRPPFPPAMRILFSVSVFLFVVYWGLGLFFVCLGVFCVIPTTFFTQALSPLLAVSPFSVSMNLFLFCC